MPNHPTLTKNIENTTSTILETNICSSAHNLCLRTNTDIPQNLLRTKLPPTSIESLHKVEHLPTNLMKPIWWNWDKACQQHAIFLFLF